MTMLALDQCLLTGLLKREMQVPRGWISDHELRWHRSSGRSRLGLRHHALLHRLVTQHAKAIQDLRRHCSRSGHPC